MTVLQAVSVVGAMVLVCVPEYARSVPGETWTSLRARTTRKHP